MKTIEELRVNFEKTKLFIELNNSFEVYYSNVGGYRYVDSGERFYYLNGAFAMFQEFNK